MIEKIRAARGKRATNKPAAPPAPESPWVVEEPPTPQQDAINTEFDERQRRLAVLDQLINGVR